MDLKKELKAIFEPDLKRVVLAILLLFLFSLISMGEIGSDFESTANGVPFVFHETISADVPMPPGMETVPSVNFIFWAFVADLLIWYAVSSIGLYLLKKVRK